MVERRLGRGLDSLISSTTGVPDRQVVDIPLDEVQPNPNQPRTVVDDGSLEGLAASIKLHGVLQPIVVQRVAAGFELVAGERRLRASRLAGRGTVPALIVDVGADSSLELALIENIQREDLRPIEEASAYDALLARTGMTHQQLAERLGKSRAAVTNALRLLELPDRVKGMVEAGALSAGQARAILGAAIPAIMERFAEAASRYGWSVREVERRVRSQRRLQPLRKGARAKSGMAQYEEELRALYGTKVSVDDHKRGQVRLAFYTVNDRERLLHMLLVGGRQVAGTDAAT